MQTQGVAKRGNCKRSDQVINGLQPRERLTMNILPNYIYNEQKSTNYNNKSYAIASYGKKNT